jgi:hypothetical protein
MDLNDEILLMLEAYWWDRDCCCCSDEHKRGAACVCKELVSILRGHGVDVPGAWDRVSLDDHGKATSV